MVQARREFILYLAFSVLLLSFDRTYAIFSHGVSSLSMTLMFLPVLLGGLVFVLLRALMKHRLYKHRLYRLFTFLYHSSIALFVNGMLVKGILEIAGTGSKYIVIFQLLAGMLAIVSCGVLYMIIKGKNKIKRA
ncbi:MAG: hypothetical protein CVU85_06790 [Firmicutes bacterium HGW-Firmicutes-10]|jgi:hypothetical protein|nr:MAG: hypothetical protein CVU85_06790 [Firmicutes bacterium HGW-Firmicutes-10]